MYIHIHIYIYIYIHITRGQHEWGRCKSHVFFDRGTCWVPICQNMPSSLNCAYLFPQSVKHIYFRSDPIRVDPTCPQPSHEGGPFSKLEVISR